MLQAQKRRLIANSRQILCSSGLMGLLLLAGVANAQQPSTKPPPTWTAEMYQHAKWTVTRVQQEMQLMKQSMARDRLGKEFENWPYDPRYPKVDNVLIDSRFKGPLEDMEAAIKQLDADYCALAKSEISPEEFSARIYDHVELAVLSLWILYLDDVEGGAWPRHGSWSLVFLAEQNQLSARQSDERDRTRDALDENGMKARDLRQSAARKALFLDIARRYEFLKNQLSEARVRWGGELWAWFEVAKSRKQADDDVHARAMTDLQQAIHRNFDNGVRELHHYIFDCGNDYDDTWCKEIAEARLFPEILRSVSGPAGEEYHLSMGGMVEVLPADRISRSAPPIPTASIPLACTAIPSRCGESTVRIIGAEPVGDVERSTISVGGVVQVEVIYPCDPGKDKNEVNVQINTDSMKTPLKVAARRINATTYRTDSIRVAKPSSTSKE